MRWEANPKIVLTTATREGAGLRAPLCGNSLDLMSRDGLHPNALGEIPGRGDEIEGTPPVSPAWCCCAGWAGASRCCVEVAAHAVEGFWAFEEGMLCTHVIDHPAGCAAVLCAVEEGDCNLLGVASCALWDLVVHNELSLGGGAAGMTLTL